MPVTFYNKCVSVLRGCFPPSERVSRANRLCVSYAISHGGVRFLFYTFLRSNTTIIFSSRRFLSAQGGPAAYPRPILATFTDYTGGPCTTRTLSNCVTTRGFILPPFCRLPTSSNRALSFSILSPMSARHFPTTTRPHK